MNYGEKYRTLLFQKNDSLEIIHHKFCKFALRISTNVPNLAIYGELGHVPLSVHRGAQMVK